MKYAIQFADAGSVNLVLGALGQLPYARVADLIHDIEGQAREQERAAAAAAAAAIRGEHKEGAGESQSAPDGG